MSPVLVDQGRNTRSVVRPAESMERLDFLRRLHISRPSVMVMRDHRSARFGDGAYWQMA